VDNSCYITNYSYLTTFNNISAISWRSVLLVEKTGVPEENHRPTASHWQTNRGNIVEANNRGENANRKIYQLVKYDIAEILLKVALNTITLLPQPSICLLDLIFPFQNIFLFYSFTIYIARCSMCVLQKINCWTLSTSCSVLVGVHVLRSNFALRGINFASSNFLLSFGTVLTVLLFILSLHCLVHRLFDCLCFPIYSWYFICIMCFLVPFLCCFAYRVEFYYYYYYHLSLFSLDISVFQHTKLIPIPESSDNC
jgi:hypothetical protein